MGAPAGIELQALWRGFWAQEKLAFLFLLGVDMIFEANLKNKILKACPLNWIPKELELEDYLISTATEGEQVPTLNPDIFGEKLLLISKEVRTRSKKRADILALDQMGNAVIVELKRNSGMLGVDTQALQYLADFSKYKGEDFIKRFSKDCSSLDDKINGFFGDDFKIEDLNKGSRIILVARSFDPTLYSMGEWLSDKGVPYRCITYTPTEYAGKYFLGFSVAFDRSSTSIYPVSFQSSIRQPKYYWHNIGKNNDDWWQYLVRSSQIATSFNNQPGDQGKKILTGYIKGDTILAYTNRYGLIGWGIIEKPDSYKLIPIGGKEDVAPTNSGFRHRLNISWKSTVDNIKDGLKSNKIKEMFDIYHPVSTCVSIKNEKAKKLIEYFNANM